jgi:RNA polymerase sigma factor for flagellar operon FliA
MSISAAKAIMSEDDDESLEGIPNTPEQNLRVYDGSNIADRDYLVRRHMDHADRLVRTMLMRLPKSISYDDLMQAALTALVAKANKWHDTEERFSACIPTRIKGAIMDFLRQMDAMPRGGRKLIRAYENYVANHPSAPIAEVAVAIGYSQESIQHFFGIRKMLRSTKIEGEDTDHWEISASRMSVVDAVAGLDYEDDSGVHLNLYGLSPEDILITLERRKIRHQAEKVVPKPIEAQVYTLYASGITLKEIASIIGFTESNASQLLTKAKERMRKWVSKNLDT